MKLGRGHDERGILETQIVTKTDQNHENVFITAFEGKVQVKRSIVCELSNNIDDHLIFALHSRIIYNIITGGFQRDEQ